MRLWKISAKDQSLLWSTASGPCSIAFGPLVLLTQFGKPSHHEDYMYCIICISLFGKGEERTEGKVFI